MTHQIVDFDALLKLGEIRKSRPSDIVRSRRWSLETKKGKSPMLRSENTQWRERSPAPGGAKVKMKTMRTPWKQGEKDCGPLPAKGAPKKKWFRCTNNS